jgi:hypothetical protein
VQLKVEETASSCASSEKDFSPPFVDIPVSGKNRVCGESGSAKP